MSYVKILESTPRHHCQSLSQDWLTRWPLFHSDQSYHQTMFSLTFKSCHRKERRDFHCRSANFHDGAWHLLALSTGSNLKWHQLYQCKSCIIVCWVVFQSSFYVALNSIAITIVWVSSSGPSDISRKSQNSKGIRWFNVAHCLYSWRYFTFNTFPLVYIEIESNFFKLFINCLKKFTKLQTSLKMKWSCRLYAVEGAMKG